MKKIVYRLCLFIGVIFTAIVLHKVLNIVFYTMIGQEKKAFLQNLFDDDKKALDFYIQSSAEFFDLASVNSKRAILNFVSSTDKINTEEISKEDALALLQIYKNSIFKIENSVGIKNLYSDFLKKLSTNKDAFTLVFAKKFGSDDENLILENADALSINMDFYLLDFYSAMSVENQMQIVACAFVNSMNDKLKNCGVCFFVKDKNLNSSEDDFYNYIDCSVTKPIKKSDIANFANQLETVTNLSLKNTRETLLTSVKEEILEKLFRLHENAYKRIIGIYLK